MILKAVRLSAIRRAGVRCQEIIDDFAKARSWPAPVIGFDEASIIPVETPPSFVATGVDLARGEDKTALLTRAEVERAIDPSLPPDTFRLVGENVVEGNTRTGETRIAWSADQIAQARVALAKQDALVLNDKETETLLPRGMTVAEARAIVGGGR